MGASESSREEDPAPGGFDAAAEEHRKRSMAEIRQEAAARRTGVDSLMELKRDARYWNTVNRRKLNELSEEDKYSIREGLIQLAPAYTARTHS